MAADTTAWRFGLARLSSRPAPEQDFGRRAGRDRRRVVRDDGPLPQQRAARGRTVVDDDEVRVAQPQPTYRLGLPGVQVAGPYGHDDRIGQRLGQLGGILHPQHRNLSPEQFKEKIAAGEFLEYEEVYPDRFYGTLKQQVEDQGAAGQNVVFDVDVKGGCSIKRHYGDRALSVFIQPPSVDELRRRLEGRATDAPEVIEQRLAKAEYELTFADQFDTIIVNDDLAKAQAEALRVVSEFLGI